MAVKKIQMYRRNLDGTETNLNPLTESQHVLMENGQTVQEILSDRDSDKYTPVITNSSSTFKVGQGDSVDLSSSIKEGAYDSCVLKGRTLVNCIQEPSSQDVVLPYEFTEGQYVTINDTKESGALGVELKGQTLVNLHKRQRYDLAQSTETSEANKFTNVVNEDNLTSFDMMDDKGYGWGSFVRGGNLALDMLKPNTKYLVYFGVAIFPEYFGVSFRDGSSLNPISTSVQVNKGTNYAILTTNQQIVKSTQLIYISIPQQCRGHYEFKDIMLIEYQDGMENWDIPYFEGMASVKAPTVKTVGKNLFDLASASNGFLSTNAPYSLARPDYHNKTSSYVRVKPNTKYTYSFDGFAQSQVGNLYWTGFYYYKRVGEVSTVYPSRMTFTGVNQISFTTPSDCNYIRIGSRGLMLDGATVQLEESTTTTTYEPYKSTTLTIPKEVVLRSLPNGVCDTYNTRTGTLTQNCMELIYDGVTNSGANIGFSSVGTTSNTNAFSLHLPSLGFDTARGVCDRLKTIGLDDDKTGIVFGRGGAGNVFIKTDKTVSNVAQFKEWLKNNNIRVVVRTTPIITKIDLKTILKPHNTATHIYSEIPQNSLYPILSRSNPTYPVILKPSTKYSVVANSYSNNHTNSPINFNLGGATASATVGNRVTTVTTPSALSNNLLTMSGRGNKLNHVMVIEGEVVGDEPYFEGICDIKSPVVKNVGKNLFDLNGEWVKCVYSYGVPQVLLSHSGTIAISNNGFSITTQANDYNRGFGQYINVSSLDTLYVKATAIYTDTKTAPELKVIGLYENESIPVSVNSINSSDFKVITKKFGSEQEVSFDLDIRSYSKIFIMFSGGWKSEMSGSYTFTMKDVYIGGSNQTCEPHKSNTTTFNQKDGKTIVLRSLPNGVCDTLNVETGEYVQRIRGKVFDGKDNGWQVLPYPPHDNDTHYQFKYWFGENLIGGDLWNNAQSILANTLPSASGALHWSSQGKYGIGGDRSHFMITWEKSSSPFHDVATLNAWLQANPITVQYQLATPIVSTVDVQGFPYAYTNGHVQLSSGYNGQSLTPKVEYSLSANKTGQINSNSKIVMKHQKQLDDFEAMMLTSMVQSAYDKAILQFDYEMRMMSLGGE